MGALGFAQWLFLTSAIGFAGADIPVQGPRGPRYARGILKSRQVTYSNSQRNSGADASFGASGQTTTCDSGVTQWLSGSGTHNFYGNVNNYGQIIVSQTDALKSGSLGGQTCDYSGSDTSNGNLVTGAGSIISLNDYGSASAPTYTWSLNTMQNYGNLQMCGRGDTGGSTYQLYCNQDCYNYGVIDMSQYYNNLGASFVWRNNNLYPPGSTTTQNCYNHGCVRLSNVVYHNVQNVLGTGCYSIGLDSTLYLEDGSGYYQNVNLGPTFPNQTILFSNTNGCLHMDTQVYSHNSDFGPQVYGFGSGHSIEFYETLSSTSAFTYDSVNGILTCRMTSGNSCNIKVGTGYDASQFYVANNPTHYNTAGYNAIFYRGATPGQSAPSVCSPSVGTCADPEQTFANFGASSTSSGTGYVTTTVPYMGTDTITGTVTSTLDPSGTNQGTVYVETPAPYVTATSHSSGVTTAYTTTIPQVGTTPGTVLVVAPSTTTAMLGPNQCLCRAR